MGLYLTNDTELTSIANAIRTKGGTSASLIYPGGFISAIESIYSKVEGLINRTISEINDSNVSNIGVYAFASCRSLTTVSFPMCTSIGSSAFYSCTALTSVSFPVCTTIGSYAFNHCSALTSAIFPVCTTIKSYVFYGCSALASIDFPVCTTIGNDSFQGCTALTSASFPKCTTIESYAFQSCSNLESVYFMGSAFISLSSTNVFTNTPMSKSTYLGYYGSIYVPASMLASYKTRIYWSTYSNRLVGI